RTNYAAENERIGKRLNVAQANSEQALVAKSKAEADLENYVKLADSRLNASEALLKTKIDELDRLSRKYAEDFKTIQDRDAALLAARLEVERRQADVGKLRDTLKLETDKNISLVKEANTMRDSATASQLQSAALLDRNKQLQ